MFFCVCMLLIINGKFYNARTTRVKKLIKFNILYELYE